MTTSLLELLIAVKNKNTKFAHFQCNIDMPKYVFLRGLIGYLLLLLSPSICYQIQKVSEFDPRGEGGMSAFFKYFEIQKKSESFGWSGGTLDWELLPIFSLFL